MPLIKFSLAARCEAAGRQNNEDNFQLTDDLCNDQWGFLTDKEGILSEKGALLVVCDGMGGMNAGEIASDLAVKTTKEWFSADRLTPQVTASVKSIEHHIREAIMASDTTIKEMGRQNSEQEGMGCTIVIAWIIGENVHIGWCGDSRAYRYNPMFGLEQLSHDHSYVQCLVDSGKLSEELAFDHPDGNIIIRCLGDTSRQAQPDVKSFPLYNNDIILLCSDGLNSVLRDKEIESVMSEHVDTLENCRNALWTTSEKAGWTDNVTIALCRILSGGLTVKNDSVTLSPENAITESRKQKPSTFIITIVVLLMLMAFIAGHYVGIGTWFPKINFPNLNFLNLK